MNRRFRFLAAVVATNLFFSIKGASSFGVRDSPATTTFLFPPRYRSARTSNSCFAASSSNTVDSTSSATEKVKELDTVASNIDFDQAHESFESDEPSAEAHLDLARTAKQRGDLAQASQSFKRALQLDANNTDMQYELGVTLAQMGYIQEAQAIFSRIVDTETPSPRPSKSLIALANLRLDGLGQRKLAYKLYRDACEAGSVALAVLAGVTADSLGNHSEACEFYTRGLQANQADEEAAMHLLIGHLREGGDKEEATRNLRSRLPSHLVASVDYVLSTTVRMDPSVHYFTYDMLQLALQGASLKGGLILEFGVYHGKTIRMIASHYDTVPVHGFDTFSGIPEDWYMTPQNSYSTHGTLPQAPNNVQYHVGLFSDTLPSFLEAHPDMPVALMNIDCDLYSSTKDVLEIIWDRVLPGTIIIFDEYVLNPHWQDDEYKAFQEAVAKHGWRYKYLGISLVSQQAVVQIVE